MRSEERPVITLEMVTGETYKTDLAYREYENSYAMINLVTTISATGPIAAYELEIDGETMLRDNNLDTVIREYNAAGTDVSTIKPLDTIVFTFVRPDQSPVVIKTKTITHIIGDLAGGAFDVQSSYTTQKDAELLDTVPFATIEVISSELGRHCVAAVLSLHVSDYPNADKLEELQDYLKLSQECFTHASLTAESMGMVVVTME